MRVPRKIKKAAKHVEHQRPHESCGLLWIPYDTFVVKGRRTKWKLRFIEIVKRKVMKKYHYEWEHTKRLLIYEDMQLHETLLSFERG